MKKFFQTVCFVSLLLLTTGCGTKAIVVKNQMPSSVVPPQQANLPVKNAKISLFVLSNYTDTPEAGMRATNIIEGMLISKGYHVVEHFGVTTLSLEKEAQIAQQDGSDYFFRGGVSEWRYKTGIDGEPAVSFQCTLYDAKTLAVVWSATGADSRWGNDSIGTTAQNLLEQMLKP